MAPECCASMKLVCEEFNDETPIPPVVSSMRCLQAMSLLYIPGFILWSPLEQLATLRISIMCSKCADKGVNNISLHAIGWRDVVENNQNHVKFMEIMGCVWWLGEFILLLKVA